MTQGLFEIQYVSEVAPEIYTLGFRAEQIARQVKGGQFVNIRVAEGTDPLLRRPFSVYRTVDDNVEIVFNIVGRGSSILRKKQRGELLDVLGPLGVPFALDTDNFETAILIGGGLGVAPLPLTTLALKGEQKPIVTILGARSSSLILKTHLDNVRIATDDGSLGYHGTVLDLLVEYLHEEKPSSPKIFACGPTPMLKAVAKFAIESDLPCEVSLEGAMACGIGLCQGCPVEMKGDDLMYELMCKSGPAFDVRKIRL